MLTFARQLDGLMGSACAARVCCELGQVPKRIMRGGSMSSSRTRVAAAPGLVCDKRCKKTRWWQRKEKWAAGGVGSYGLWRRRALEEWMIATWRWLWHVRTGDEARTGGGLRRRLAVAGGGDGGGGRSCLREGWTCGLVYGDGATGASMKCQYRFMASGAVQEHACEHS